MQTGETDLKKMLATLSPELQSSEFVFCSVKGELTDYLKLNPIASFQEQEGLTIVLSLKSAKSAGLSYSTVFKQITLQVHSSLDAVGLTAAFASKLTEHGISANVIAGYYHDHIFVQTDKADLAINALLELTA